MITLEYVFKGRTYYVEAIADDVGRVTVRSITAHRQHPDRPNFTSVDFVFMPGVTMMPPSPVLQKIIDHFTKIIETKLAEPMTRGLHFDAESYNPERYSGMAKFCRDNPI